MITVLLILQFFNGLIAALNPGQVIDFAIKPIMCGFGGDKAGSINDEIPLMITDEIPAGCQVLIYTSSVIDNKSISCDEDIVKDMVDTGRPVILEIFRSYECWKNILTSDGNIEDAQAIVNYTTSLGFVGILLRGMSPFREVVKNKFGTFGSNLPLYLTQLKNDPDFYVGISLYTYYPDELADSNILNYDDTNDLVDFFIINTFRLNFECDSELFNGETPITASRGLIGLDSVVSTLQSTNISVDKTFLVIDLIAFNARGHFSSYVQVCGLNNTDIAQWCAPTTKDYYDKAAYIKQNDYGVCVLYVEFDDITNDCGCGPFIGFQNIEAGFHDQSPKPCALFDAKDNIGSS